MLLDSNIFASLLNITPSYNSGVSNSKENSLDNLCKEFNIPITNDIYYATAVSIGIESIQNFRSTILSLDTIDKNVLDVIIKNKLNFIISFYYEHDNPTTSQWANDWFTDIFSKIENLGIPLEQIILLTGDVNVSNKDTGKFNCLSINAFEYLYYKNMLNLIIDKNNDIHLHTEFKLDKKYDFLFLNSRPSPERCVLRYELFVSNLLKKSINSWVIGNRKVDYLNINNFVYQHMYKNKTYIENVYNNSLKEVTLDSSRENLIKQAKQNIIPKEWRASTSFSLITETTVQKNNIFLTEKTYKAILHKHPFILFSSNGSLKYLKSLGYETFNELFDESYDNCSIYHKIQIIKENLKRFKKIRCRNKINIITEKLNHNYNLFLKQPSLNETKNTVIKLIYG